MNRRIGSGAALVAASILLGFAVTAGWFAAFDTLIMRSIALTSASPHWLVTAARTVSSLGNPDIRAAIVILIGIAFVARQCWRSALVYLATVIISVAGHTQAKLFFDRSRPRLSPWLDRVTDMSYPSGHAAGAMVVLLTAALLVRERWLRVPAVVLALAIAATRPMLGVHWPTDVIGGALWGAGFALIGAGVAAASGLPRVRVLPG